MELRRLRWELEEKNKHTPHQQQIDPQQLNQLTQLEQEKRRAEEEKQSAINALEVRSKEYLMEREEKKRLEEKIKMMDS